jgi:GST-like protein
MLVKKALFDPEKAVLGLSPNGRIPALVDRTVDGEQIKIFESGAILQYPGRKSGLLYPLQESVRCAVDSWLSGMP